MKNDNNQLLDQHIASVVGFRGFTGASWGVVAAFLEASWVVMGRQGSILLILGPASSARHPPLGGPRGAKMRPKWDLRGTKIDVKNEVEKRCS